MRTAVFGAGSWGTTFAKVLADAGNEVTLWARRAELADRINADRINAEYLPGITLPPGLTATDDPSRALRDVQLVAIAIPAQSLRVNLAEWAGAVPSDATLVSLMKGVELGTTKRMSEVIADVTGADLRRIAVAERVTRGSG